MTDSCVIQLNVLYSTLHMLYGVNQLKSAKKKRVQISHRVAFYGGLICNGMLLDESSFCLSAMVREAKRLTKRLIHVWFNLTCNIYTVHSPILNRETSSSWWLFPPPSCSRKVKPIFCLVLSSSPIFPASIILATPSGCKTIQNSSRRLKNYFCHPCLSYNTT